MTENVDRIHVLAVLGPGAGPAARYEVVARQIGRLAAERGWALLTGGGPGVMESASRGAAEAGGLTLGILPNGEPAGAYPNPWVRLPVFTGAGMARNAFNVLTADLCVALSGGPGTLSEIGLALKAGVEVWTWDSWVLQPPDGYDGAMPRTFRTSDELLEALGHRLR